MPLYFYTELVSTFRHLDIFGSLPIASSLLPFCLEFVQNYRWGWHLLRQQFQHVELAKHFFKEEKIREVRGRRPEQGQKGRRVFRPVEQSVVDVSAESYSPSLDQKLPLLVQCV